ncbi:MAG: helix-turn-helix transcriptional regulator [Spirosomataceae bacterium]
MKAIAERIRQFRLQKGYSQENMADLLGLSTTAYGDIERGKASVSIQRLQAIAEILGTDLSSLLGISPVVSDHEFLKLNAKIEVLALENQLLRQHNEQLKLQLERQLSLEIIGQIQRNQIGFGQRTETPETK